MVRRQLEDDNAHNEQWPTGWAGGNIALPSNRNLCISKHTYTQGANSRVGQDTIHSVEDLVRRRAPTETNIVADGSRGWGQGICGRRRKDGMVVAFARKRHGDGGQDIILVRERERETHTHTQRIQPTSLNPCRFCIRGAGVEEDGFQVISHDQWTS